MSLLIVGPSCVGKSTLLKTPEFLTRQQIFGYQIPTLTSVPSGAIIHYNMIHHALAFGDDMNRASLEWDFLAEPIFKRISEQIDECIVLVAPINTLKQRMKDRQHVEDHLPADIRYDSTLWLNIVERLDLYRIYGSLFKFLDDSHIPFRVLLSEHGSFKEIDRAFLHLHLQG